MQRDAADKLDALVETTRLEAERDSAKTANIRRPAPIPWPPRRPTEIGYSSEESAFCETDTETPSATDSRENPEWSHLDSNQGPPACEAGALTS